MKVEMNDDGEINLNDIDIDQISLLVDALQASPNQKFMEDMELSQMFKLLSILQSEVFHDLDSGKVNVEQFDSGVS